MKPVFVVKRLPNPRTTMAISKDAHLLLREFCKKRSIRMDSAADVAITEMIDKYEGREKNK